MTDKVEDKLKKIIKDTTIYLIQDQSFKDMFGRDKITRFVIDQGSPKTIDELENIWQKIFKKFGNNWNKERQLYRFLYDETRLFITSFTYLRIHKVNYLNSHFTDEASYREFSVYLASMYLFGKKSIDLIKEIDKIKKSKVIFPEIFKKFANTRNIIFEHNSKPWLLDGFLVDPSFFEASGSTSKLRIRIHSGDEENIYNAFVDFYEDYYKLETKIISWLNKQ